MSRFVRASKYRHVFGQSGKKEYGYENVKVTNSAWDTNVISASAKYISINWNASGGGAFAVLPLPTPFAPVQVSSFPNKLPDSLPLARSHTAPVLDTDWSPHDDSLVASGGEDGKLNLWKIDAADFDGWNSEDWVPRDFDPIQRIDASPRKIGQVLWHPTAHNVLASASGEHTVKLWDLNAGPESAKIVLGPHGDAIQSMSFNSTGTILATTSRDKKIRLFDPRAGGDPVRIGDGHGGIKGSRVVWMGDMDRIATTGFSKMSDRQVGIWETGGLGSQKMIVLDQSSGVVMPFWSDNNILFLAGKGDGNIRYYEYESDSLYALSEHKSSDPQRGMAFLPRRALSVNDCEIARAYKLHGSSVEPIAFIVPRKADSFQSDIFPPAPSSEPSLSSGDFFAGKNVARKLVALDTGVTSTSTSASASSAPAPAPAAQAPTKSFSAPPPSAQSPAPISPTVSKTSEPVTPAVPVETPKSQISRQPSQSQKLDDGPSSAAAEAENQKLTAELREARARIRELELQVETMKVNARKAAQALLDG